MFSKHRGFHQDDRASSVMFATLLLILVAITVVSGLALMISVTQKENMDRQTLLEAQKNENLKIVTIHPTKNDLDSKYWDSLDFTVLNSDINEARINAISINNKFFLNCFLMNENGKLIEDKKENPLKYNASNKITVPAEKAVQIHVGGIPLLGTVNYNGSSFTPLNNSPSDAYPNVDSSGWLDVYDSSGIHVGHGDFTVTDNQVAANNVNVSGSIPNGDYNVTYTTFLNNELNPNDPQTQELFATTHSITVEIISGRVNLFSKRFMPPIPVADVQSKTDGSGNYLILDASNSNDLDGFITSYLWEIYPTNDNATPLESLTGNKERTNHASNVNIDLIVTNNYGMVSRLSDPGRSGRIPIPP